MELQVQPQDARGIIMYGMPRKKTATGPVASERVNMIFDAETFRMLNEFRFAHQFETRTEAVIWLVRNAISAGLRPKPKGR